MTNKLIPANEAHIKSIEKLKESAVYPDYVTMINKAIEKGKLECTINLPKNVYHVVLTEMADGIIAACTSNGYKAKRVVGYDQQEGDDWDYITISW